MGLGLAANEIDKRQLLAGNWKDNSDCEALELLGMMENHSDPVDLAVFLSW